MGLSLISAILFLLLSVCVSSLIEVVRKWWLVRRMPCKWVADLSNLSSEPSVRTAQMMGQLNRLDMLQTTEVA